MTTTPTPEDTELDRQMHALARTYAEGFGALSTRTNRHLAHPDHGGGEAGEGEEVGGEAVVAGCEAPEVFEFVEASLDAVAQAVEDGVVRDGYLSRPGRGDDGAGSGSGEPASQRA